MVLWRISVYRDLSGLGALIMEGRWHYAGQPVVYLAEHPAAALLEVCVHTSAANIPPEFTLLRVEGPDIPHPTVDPSQLPADWRSNLAATRTLGTEWLKGRESVLLRVPSAVVPRTTNFLFNPVHPDAKSFTIVEEISYPFDVRTKQ